MPHAKLDCQMLDSTTWADRPARELFITALLMGEPHVVEESMEQIEVRTLDHTGFMVPPGCYGLVRAAGSGIIKRACFREDEYEEGYKALERLGAPEPESRNPAWEGRRLVRVNGGYIVLNFEEFRKRDATTAERSRRYREKQKELAEEKRHAVTSRDITQAEAEAEAEAGTTTDSKSVQLTVPTASKPIVAKNVVDTLAQLSVMELKKDELLTAQCYALFSYYCHKTKKRKGSTQFTVDRFNRLKRHIEQRGLSFCLYVCDGGVKHPHLQQEGKPRNWELDSFFPHTNADRIEKLAGITKCDREPIHPLVREHPELGGGHE